MLVCFLIDGKKLLGFFTKDQGLACMSGAKKIWKSRFIGEEYSERE
jgi:hypothetical protein